MTQKEKAASFNEAVLPLIQWLCENENPHSKIIVSNDGAELFEAKMGTGFIETFILE